MSKFTEYLEQVGLRGQSARMIVRKMAIELGETLESIISNWKTEKKQLLFINYNLPRYGITHNIQKLIKDHDGFSGKFSLSYLKDKKIVNLIKGSEKRFVFITMDKVVSIDPTLKARAIIANLVMDATKGEIEVK